MSPVPGGDVVVAEQHGVGFHCEAIGGIGGGVEAELAGLVVEPEYRQPVGAIEGDEAAFIEKEGTPAGLRGVEQPGGAVEMGNIVGVAGPVAGGGRCDDVAVAGSGGDGRGVQMAVEHSQLRQHIEGNQRLVVGDVLLRLSGEDEGEVEMGAGGHGRDPRFWRG